MVHPDIVEQLGQLRQIHDLDVAARERAIHSAAPHRPPVARWLRLAAVVGVPAALWAMWEFVAH